MLIECYGLLSFGARVPATEEFRTYDFREIIFGEAVTLDHLVITQESPALVKRYAERVVCAGGKIVEGPGRWPLDFCDLDLDADLAMYLATVHAPGDGLVVLASPLEKGDQLSRFRKTRGPGGVHHVAIGVADLNLALRCWRERGFREASPIARDGALEQVFVANQAKQLVELIRRPRSGNDTFTCDNLATLRESEG